MYGTSQENRKGKIVPNALHVLGYTSEEEIWRQRFIDVIFGVDTYFPLIEKNIDKM